MKIRMLDFLNFMIFVIEYLVLPPKQVSLQQLEGFHFQTKIILHRYKHVSFVFNKVSNSCPGLP